MVNTFIFTFWLVETEESIVLGYKPTYTLVKSV